MRKERRANRTGAVLIMALVILAIVTGFVLSFARLALIQRDVARTALWRAQAAWLAESGVERAASRLAANPDYLGETWRIAPEALDDRYAGAVDIRVDPLSNIRGHRRVTVRAVFPDDPHHRAQSSKTVLVAVARQE